MKTKAKTIILVALLIALTLPAYAGGVVGMVSNAVGGDRGPQTGGKVTVRGLSRYEGKFVMGVAESDTPLLAAGNISSGGVISAAAIKGGKATMKVWRSYGGALDSFDGNVTDTLILSIYDGQSPTDDIAKGLVEVNFRRGSGSGTGVFIDGGAFGGVVDRGFGNVVSSSIADANVSVASGGSSSAVSSGDEGGFFSRVGGFFGGLFGGNKSDTETVASGNGDGNFFSRLFGGNRDTDSSAASGNDSGGGGLFGSLFGGNRDTDSSAASGNDSGGGGLFGSLFGGGSSGGGGIGWTEVRVRDLEFSDGTWVADYTMSVMDGIKMTIVQTVVIRGNKPTSHVIKQTLSGQGVAAMWPALKMVYEGGFTPGTHRVNDAQHSIETTYDPNDPIFSGAAYEGADNSDGSVRAYINGARNRVRIVLDNEIVPEIVYVKR